MILDAPLKGRFDPWPADLITRRIMLRLPGLGEYRTIARAGAHEAAGHGAGVFTVLEN